MNRRKRIPKPVTIEKWDVDEGDGTLYGWDDGFDAVPFFQPTDDFQETTGYDPIEFGRRLAALLNACKDIPTEHIMHRLEDGWLLKGEWEDDLPLRP